VATRRFQFQLERLRRLREQRKLAAAADLAVALADQALREELLAQADRQLAGAASQARSLFAKGPVDGSELAAVDLYRQRVERERAQREADLAAAEAQAQARRELLARSAQEQQMLERLRARRLNRHRREVARLETALLDEIAAGRRKAG
jgi:flagellar export protein FliJ